MYVKNIFCSGYRGDTAVNKVPAFAKFSKL